MKSTPSKETQLSARHKLWVVTLVMGIGLLLALPFQRSRRHAADEEGIASEKSNSSPVTLSIDSPPQAGGVGGLVNPDPVVPVVRADERPMRAPADLPLGVFSSNPPVMDENYTSLLEQPERQLTLPGRTNRPSRLEFPQEDESRPASATHRTHRLKDGDRLVDLAARYLGDAARAMEIWELNRDQLSDPEILPLGAVIKIPAGE